MRLQRYHPELFTEQQLNNETSEGAAARNMLTSTPASSSASAPAPTPAPADASAPAPATASASIPVTAPASAIEPQGAQGRGASTLGGVGTAPMAGATWPAGDGRGQSGSHGQNGQSGQSGQSG